MKKVYLFGLLIILYINCFSQVVVADPAHNQLGITNASNIVIDENALPIGTVVDLKVPVLNLNTASGVPSGSCKIKIGLGSKMELDPSFDLGSTNTSSFFDWTVALQGGQYQLTGDLKANLPPNYSVIAAFRVRGSVLGTSTITANFLITNHNTATILSDENPNNNTSFLPYTVVAPVPVTFTGIAVKKIGCGIAVNFSAEAEVNVSHYEIEASKDGIFYQKMGQLPADNRINYKYTFPLTANIQTSTLQIRVKSVDRDGKLQYTAVKSVKGTCTDKLSIGLYPNPVPRDYTNITIQAEEGLFNGTVSLTLLDITGKLLNTKRINLSNAQQFTYATGTLAAGQYLLKIQAGENEAPVVLRFQKL